MSIVGVDLFCGAGGLTRGLELEGIEVRGGYDVDPACRYPYEANNWGQFVEADVAQLTPADIARFWDGSRVRLLAGCAPCQPFSTYTQARSDELDPRWQLLGAFSRLVLATRPELITMENVADLRRHTIYERFVRDLSAAGYAVDAAILDCEAYGVPQRRRRLVLLASLLGEVKILTPDEFGASRKTVRDAIQDLPPVGHGRSHPNDPLHKSSALSPTNLRRIQSSRPGGSWHDWDEALVAPCHARDQGKGYRGVYGRMEWDKAAPTITTQAFGFGSGRFGHPEQDRALSLREAAMLQTFPRDYAFTPPGIDPPMKTIGRLIGNAVPVRLGRVVGRSLVNHVRSFDHQSKGDMVGAGAATSGV
ncbi:DNA cytosine methyltransferase [Methylobacterium planeticum]|nr:DNA cytosine methyltransferase [Methylobacterium planeticum]